jgi:hypothetical protein
MVGSLFGPLGNDGIKTLFMETTPPGWSLPAFLPQTPLFGHNPFRDEDELQSGSGGLGRPVGCYDVAVLPPDDTDGARRYGTDNAGIGPVQRLLFAAVGLAAGNAALLVFLLYGALRMRAALVNAHMGEPYLVLPQAWGMFLMYGMFSVAGWILVGVPIALAFPARLLSHVAWPVRLLIGATLGPLALLLIFVVLFVIQGRLSAFSLAHTESLWPFSVVISTISFLVYAALLRRCLSRSEQ